MGVGKRQEMDLLTFGSCCGTALVGRKQTCICIRRPRELFAPQVSQKSLEGGRRKLPAFLHLVDLGGGI